MIPAVPGVAVAALGWQWHPYSSGYGDEGRVIQEQLPSGRCFSFSLFP